MERVGSTPAQPAWLREAAAQPTDGGSRAEGRVSAERASRQTRRIHACAPRREKDSRAERGVFEQGARTVSSGPWRTPRGESAAASRRRSEEGQEGNPGLRRQQDSRVCFIRRIYGGATR